jgi:hypothetical protein
MIFDPLDAWFEQGFRVRKQRPATVKGDRIRSGGGQRQVPAGGMKFSGNAKAGNARAIIKRAPEVMVKITGSSSGTDTAKHHVDYISRNGSVELENERGELVDRKDLMRELKASQVPKESGKREFLHVLFSMPPGTPEKALKDSVREFCKEEFANRQYMIALHRDTDHVHCHVCVGTRDMYRANEPRLSPRKADLTRWRLGFADKLREHGIDAAASERRHRFQHRKGEHPIVRQIRADNPKSAVFNRSRAEGKAADKVIKSQMWPDKAFIGPPRPPRTPRVYQSLGDEIKAALRAGKRPENPAKETMEQNRAEARAIWQAVEEELKAAGKKDLAADVRELLREAEKPVTSRNQELYDQAKARTQDHTQARD